MSNFKAESPATLSTGSESSSNQELSPVADAIRDLSQLLKACGDPLRLQILQVLKLDTFGVLELTQLFDTKQSGMSHHLKVLSNVGLVETQREGNAIFYRRPFHQGRVEAKTLEQVFALVDHCPPSEELLARIGTINEQRALQSKAFFEKNAERFQEQQELICEYEQYASASFELLQKCGVDENSTVLELGPGAGQFLKPLSLNYAQVIALDTSSNMLDQAKQYATMEGLDNISFVHGDSSDFLASGESVQAVVMNMVLHHVPTPAKIFEDCQAMLSEGGVLVVCDLSRHDQDWAKENCGDLWLGFEPQELSRWAKDVGLCEEESVFIGLRNGFQIQLHTYVKPSSPKLV